jgi:signal transduction histidine kinase
MKSHNPCLLVLFSSSTSIENVLTKIAEDAIIEVEDSGPGIAPEHRTRIFERFYRVEKLHARAAGGAGLGLSIAQWAVSAHGGTIEVQCESGSGSIFRICLPKHASPVAVR